MEPKHVQHNRICKVILSMPVRIQNFLKKEYW